MSDFKSNYTTMKSSMCRLQKCKKINLEKLLLLVACFLIRGHIYEGRDDVLSIQEGYFSFQEGFCTLQK